MRFLLTTFLACAGAGAAVAARDDDRPPPSPAHEAFLSRGVIAYVFWGPNTYLDGRADNRGDQPPETIAADALDPAQWAEALADGGVRAAVLVAKADDGFCLWPSRREPAYSTRALGGRLASADLVAAFARACRRRKLGFGLALSTWDRRQAAFGDGAYLRELAAQWDEALARAGDDLFLADVGVEFGGRGWYGGAREGRGETRRMEIDDFPAAVFREKIAARHPLAVVAGRRGLGDVERLSGSRAEAADGWRFAQRRRSGAFAFTVQEVLLPLRKSRFFRADEAPRSLDEMVKAYFRTVGRSGVLAWGVSPDRSGRICAADVRRLKAFGAYVRAFEASDFARGAMVGALVGGGRETGVVATLGGRRTIDAVDFGEDLSKGQIADSWTVEVYADGGWKRVASGRSVGWRRIACFDPVATTRVRVTCRGDGLARLVRFAVRKRPEITGGP